MGSFRVIVVAMVPIIARKMPPWKFSQTFRFLNGTASELDTFGLYIIRHGDRSRDRVDI